MSPDLPRIRLGPTTVRNGVVNLGVIDGGICITHSAQEAQQVPEGQQTSGTPVRLGMTVDVEGYQTRTQRQQRDVQERLEESLGDLLAELNLRLSDVDHQVSGDGYLLIFPASIDVLDTLPVLFRFWPRWSSADNERFRDVMRLRIAIDLAPSGSGAMGFEGPAAIRLARIVDSAVVREALRLSAADVSIALSDTAFQFGPELLDVQEFRFTAATEFDKHGRKHVIHLLLP